MPCRNALPILLFTVLLAMVSACSPPSTAEDDDASSSAVTEGLDPAVLEAAEAWLAKVDAGDYQGSWEATGAMFRDEVSAEQWHESMTQVREDMGAVTERRLHEHTLETIMPGVPEGEYMMLEYRSVFEKQPQGAELVVCMKDEDGAWRVIGYFLQ
jgi:hypothetical protein